MRITLTIDDEVLALARAMAKRNGNSLGSTISDLARRGIKEMGRVEVDDTIPVFRVAPDARPVTCQDVKEALSDWP